jgi:hypothetical protein
VPAPPPPEKKKSKEEELEEMKKKTLGEVKRIRDTQHVRAALAESTAQVRAAQDRIHAAKFREEEQKQEEEQQAKARKQRHGHERGH